MKIIFEKEQTKFEKAGRKSPPIMKRIKCRTIKNLASFHLLNYSTTNESV